MLFAAILAAALAAAGETPVEFPLAPPPGTLRGLLAKPAGQGPFPAVALLPSCLGLPENRRDWETALTRAGYVALYVDDFSSRRLKQTCDVDFPPALGDALAGYAFLARQPFVDAARVAAVGFSQGGDTALKLAAAGAPFRAVAAFYPPCANLAGAALRLPALILVGGRDSVTPAGDCAGLEPARTIVYPGAEHGFDNPAFGAGVEVYGMRLAYDADSARRGQNALLRFLFAAIGQ